MTRSTSLVDTTSRKSAPTPADKRMVRENDRAIQGQVAMRNVFAGGTRDRGEPALAPITLASVSVNGNIQTLPRLDPVAPVKKAAPAPLHPIAQRLAPRVGEDAAKLLSAIATKSQAEAGAAVNFSMADAAGIMGVPEPRARAIMDSMLRSGTLRERRDAFGGRAGYGISETLL